MECCVSNIPQKLTDRRFAAGCAVLCRHLQKTIGINFEGCHQLGLSTQHRRNTVELEFTEQTVIAALSALALIAANEELEDALSRKIESHTLGK